MAKNEKANPPSLYVSRVLSPEDHQLILNHQAEIDTSFSDVDLAWRVLGKASVVLVKRGEYRHIARKAGGGEAAPLYHVRNIKNRLQRTILHRQPPLIVPLQTATFLAYDKMDRAHIGFPVESEALTTERQIVLSALKNIGSVHCELFDYAPYLTVATLPRASATESLQQAFTEIMPPTAKLLAPRAFY